MYEMLIGSMNDRDHSAWSCSAPKDKSDGWELLPLLLLLLLPLLLVFNVEAIVSMDEQRPNQHYTQTPMEIR